MILTADSPTSAMVPNFVCAISDRYYEGNLTLKSHKRLSERRTSFTLTVANSSLEGSRISPTGRRIAAGCWHAYRDVLAEIYRHSPTAKVTSAMSRYDGLTDFLNRFPLTYYANNGSLAKPSHYGTLCKCSKEDTELRPELAYLLAYAEVS